MTRKSIFVLMGTLSLAPLSVQAQTNLITNGTFEADSTGWTLSGTVISSGCCPRTGVRYAVMGDVNNANDIMWQQFTIPSNAIYCELSFWRSITSTETSTTTPFDVLNVTLQNSSGQYVATVDVWSNLHKQSSAYPYVQKYMDLTAFKGQTLRLHFRGTTDSTNPTTFRIDDVSVVYTLPIQRTLSINAQNTGSSIYIVAIPSDVYGNGVLPTPNSFTYNNGQSVYLIAAQTAPNGNHFQKWVLDGSDLGYSSVSPSFTMNSNRTLVAVYQLPPPPVLVGPGAPTGPGPVLGTLTPTFTWNAVAGASRYGLYINKFPYDGILEYQNEFVSGTSLVLPPGYLVNGSQYRWDMGTYNAAGQLGTISSELYFQTPPVQYTLTVTAAEFGTSVPIPGVLISAIPADVYGKNLDDSPFDLYYNSGQSVQLMAAATAPNGHEFLAWLLDGNEMGYNFLSEPIPMNANHTATAVYVPVQPPTSPHISLNPTALAFEAVQDGPLPTPQALTITNTGDGTLDWSVAADQAWLNVAPAAGQSNSQVVQVSVNTTALSLGTHSATLTITSANADNSPQTVGVTCNVSAPQAPAPPVITDVIDAGTGSDLIVKWTQTDRTNVTDYWILYGTEIGQWYVDDIVTENGSSIYSDVVTGRTEHTPYYVSVRAHNSATNEFSADALWPTPVRPTVPVVLIHGWNADKSSWLLWEAMLKNAGFNYRWLVDNLEACGVPGEVFFTGNANHLSYFLEAQIATLRQQNGQIDIPCVDVIAHSMGGLIARRYITPCFRDKCSQLPPAQPPYTRKFRKLIMLGTPNSGIQHSYVGEAPGMCYGDGDAAVAMSVANMQRFNEAFRKPPSGTAVYAVAGEGGMLKCTWNDSESNPTCIGGLGVAGIGALQWCPNDGLVPVWSVFYAGEYRYDETYRGPVDPLV